MSMSVILTRLSTGQLSLTTGRVICQLYKSKAGLRSESTFELQLQSIREHRHSNTLVSIVECNQANLIPRCQLAVIFK